MKGCGLTGGGSGEDDEVADEGASDEHARVSARVVAVVMQRHTGACQRLEIRKVALSDDTKIL